MYVYVYASVFVSVCMCVYVWNSDTIYTKIIICLLNIKEYIPAAVVAQLLHSDGLVGMFFCFCLYLFSTTYTTVPRCLYGSLSLTER